MATSIDGSEGLKCGDPGGEGGELVRSETCCPGSTTDFVPNCLYYMPQSSLWAPPRNINLGLSDGSIEAWVLKLDGPTAGLAPEMLVIAFTAGGYPSWHFGLHFNQQGVPGGFNRVAGTFGCPVAVLLETAFVDVPVGWHYYAVTMDRDGLLSLYIDAALVGTVNIAPQAAVNLGNTNEFWPMTLPEHFYPSSWVVGPVALHVGALLTIAQMAESFNRRFVRRTQFTQAAFDYHGILGATAWDAHINVSNNSTTPPSSHIMRMCFDLNAVGAMTANTVLLKPGTYATPLGTFGQVVLSDLTANDRFITLPTADRYGPTHSTYGIPGGGPHSYPSGLGTADMNSPAPVGGNCVKAPTLFGVDPFFI